MKPIKVIPANHAKIASLITQVHGNAKEHVATPDQIQAIANLAEAKLIGLGINIEARRGAVANARSGAKLPNSYKYSRQVSSYLLERRSRSWWLVELAEAKAWQSEGGWNLKLTPEQDAIATRIHRSQYVTAVPHEKIQADLIAACGAALVVVRGVMEYAAEEKQLNKALFAAGVRMVCNQEVTP